uniref:Uncharacterized protein n=1 Tax=Kwoniella bestiolae CBS 10118 TaxID=1296100 RepID=A0A1B9G3C4_9TREE|nr:hypothetical protein I302_05322 [Kwoniella bestiolae CBS 10118]OCF25502.1 hypothetical protein I302_05322 [Kwoniella bestiolae CBS 10118]
MEIGGPSGTQHKGNGTPGSCKTSQPDDTSNCISSRILESSVTTSSGGMDPSSEQRKAISRFLGEDLDQTTQEDERGSSARTLRQTFSSAVSKFRDVFHSDKKKQKQKAESRSIDRD